MKLQNQVCTLQQAKRLRELGITQDAQCYWRRGQVEHIQGVNSWADQQTLGEMIKEYDAAGDIFWRDKFEIYAAFTVAELGIMFGKGTNAAALLYDAVQARMNSSHSFTIVFAPQFLANGLIGLLEAGRVTAEELNHRLQLA